MNTIDRDSIIDTCFYCVPVELDPPIPLWVLLNHLPPQNLNLSLTLAKLTRYEDKNL